MFKPLEICIGLRYLRAKRRKHFISFVSFVSVIGIVLGMTTLITVLSVMNGFVTELRDRILSLASHVTISSNTGRGLSDWSDLATQLEAKIPEVKGVAPYVEGQAMLSLGQEVHAALIRGIEPDIENAVSDIADKLKVGNIHSLQPGKYNIILGRELAGRLFLTVGDKVTVITPQAISTPAGILPRLKRFTVSGIFEVGQNEYDSSMAYVNIKDAAKLYRLDNAVSGIRIKLDDLLNADRISQKIANNVDTRIYDVIDWTHRHANFFRAVKLEKVMMGFILMLIVVVALFTLLVNLWMEVREKQSDIAILRTLGMSPGSIMGLFMVKGTVVGSIGTLMGVAGGVALATNVDAIVKKIEDITGYQFMPPDVYYISTFPSELHWGDVGLVSVVALFMSVIAVIYPAWAASNTKPAEALRYE